MKLPIIIENSKIPVWLSKFAPIEIFAISFGFFIICRDKLPERTWRHEMIHYRQQQELYFIGQWFLYAYFCLRGLIKYRSAKEAYYKNPFEQEAYTNQDDPIYLLKRKKRAWKKFEV